MHPADQVVAFSQLAQSGVTVAAIAARFGVAERLVEQRLRLGNAAPELLDAYRAGRHRPRNAEGGSRSPPITTASARFGSGWRARATARPLGR